MSCGFWKRGLVARFAKGFWFWFWFCGAAGGCCGCVAFAVVPGAAVPAKAGLSPASKASMFCGFVGSWLVFWGPGCPAAGVPCAAGGGEAVAVAVGLKRAAKGLALAPAPAAAAAVGLPNIVANGLGGCGVPVVFV